MKLLKWISKQLKKSTTLLTIYLAMTLIIVLACSAQSIVPVAKTLPTKPSLEYGWLPEQGLTVEGKDIKGHCMIDDDAKKLMMYIDLIEFRAKMN
jgi:hypothetical protein